MKELINIQKELKAPKNQRNNFWNYNYRSVEDILESVKPLLTKQNCILTISDEIVLIWDRFYIKATAKISNWENSIETVAYAREALTKKWMDESQITWATSSYARKYALNWLFAIDDTKDADATNTHEETSKKLDAMDYVNRIKEEQDVNHLTTIYKEFKAQNPSDKQLKWIETVCKERKETLLAK